MHRDVLELPVCHPVGFVDHILPGGCPFDRIALEQFGLRYFVQPALVRKGYATGQFAYFVCEVVGHSEFMSLKGLNPSEYGKMYPAQPQFQPRTVHDEIQQLTVP